jgi:hypothetical protein
MESTMFRAINLIFAVFILSRISYANPILSPGEEVARGTHLTFKEIEKIYDTDLYRELIRDLLFELNHYDGVDKEDQETIEFKKALKKYLKGGKFSTFYAGLDERWREFLELDTIFQIEDGPQMMESLRLKDVSFEKHTINDLEQYVESRVGPRIASLNKNNKIKVAIHAGFNFHIKSSFKKLNQQLVRIPSLYEDWGIMKYIDLETLREEKPTVYFNIPPIREYLEHYVRMFDVNKGELEAILNLADRDNFKNSFANEVNQIVENHGIKPQMNFSLGYGRHFESVFNSLTDEWEVLSIENITRSKLLGITGKIFKLKNKVNTSIKTSLISLSADTTLWGEASSFFARAILKHNPKTITFMGSAGLLNPSLGQQYDTSIPKSFLLDDRMLEIDNNIFIHRDSTSAPPKTIWNSIHSHSYSPSEQTDMWLEEKLAFNVDTVDVDVEVNLIAKEIEKYNLDFGHVRFGVINSITDLPNLLSEEAIDLNKVMPGKKQENQSKIVRRYLKTLSRQENYILDLDKVLKEKIIQAIPNVKEKDIVLSRGIGRVSASAEHKLSYYVYSEDPYSPSRKTYVIPMATSRYDKYNYHTSEWWDKYGEASLRGDPVPRENPRDVYRYLKQNGLSTNPDVILIDGFRAKPRTIPLKDFLLYIYTSEYSENGYISLYRGVAKSNEAEVWKSGALPRGARYWTPDINYAWRYARKRDDLIEGLIKDHSPIVEFRIPVSEFMAMVDKNELILGTELPLSAHRKFDASGVFGDNLNGFPYLGNEKFGIEFEVRARKKARKKMPLYFLATVDAQKVALDRIDKIKATYKRLLKRKPEQRDQLLLERDKRIEVAKTELQIIQTSQLDLGESKLNNLLDSMAYENREFTHTSRENLRDVAKRLSGKVFNFIDEPCDDIIEGVLK